MDYSNYSLEELIDVKNNIDVELYPEKYQLLLEALRKKHREASERQSGENEPDKKLLYHNDKVAQQIKWSPLSSTNFSFKSKRLIKINHHRIELVSSIQLKVFYGFFAFVGLLLMLSTFVFDFNLSNNEKIGATILTTMLGLSILYFVTFTWNAYSTPVIFDKSVGACWKSKIPLHNIKYKKMLELYLLLKDVYAIQILNQLVNSDECDYNCFEINLVTKYGKRVNIISHGNQQKLLEQAQLLSEFLDKPIWDRSEVEFDWNSNFKFGLE